MFASCVLRKRTDLSVPVSILFVGMTLLMSVFAVPPSAVFAQGNQTKAVLRLWNDTGITIEDTGSNGRITFTTEGTTSIVVDAAGNVGIGKSPTAKLDVNGTIRATKVDSTGSGSYMHIALAHCGGACTGTGGALNTWIEVSNLGYTWITATDIGSSMLSHNGYGRITIGQTGTYIIRLQSMIVPSAVTNAPANVCPFINGAANCNGHGYYTGGVQHRYYPAGWWGRSKHEFVMTLSQGAIVGYGYMPRLAFTNWGHDNLTSMEIIRVN